MRARLHNTIPRAAVALLAVLAAVCAVSGCGNSSVSAVSLVSDTFKGHQQIESGKLDLSLAIAASGSNAATKPLSVKVSGPFQNESTNTGQLPRFALQFDLDGGGHTLKAGATSTGSALFVELEGSWFSIPQSTLKTFQQGYAQATKKASSAKVRSTFSALGIEPGNWLSDPTQVGTVTIAGVKTVHLTANVNISSFLADITKLAQSGGALGLGSSVPGLGSVSSNAISELAESVKSAHVDIYTGQSDHLLRRLEVSAVIAGTAQTQALLGGLSSADVKATLELSDINQPQTITAPSNPQPFSQLLPDLQQLLGTLSSSSSSSSGTSNGVFETLTTGGKP